MPPGQDRLSRLERTGPNQVPSRCRKSVQGSLCLFEAVREGSGANGPGMSPYWVMSEAVHETRVASTAALAPKGTHEVFARAVQR